MKTQEISEFNNDEITLKEVIIKLKLCYFFLLKKWKTIFLTGLVGASIGLFFGFLEKPLYVAELTFAMEDDKASGGLSGAIGLASSIGIDLGAAAGGGGAFAASNLSELMKSRLIVEKVLLKPIMINNQKISIADYYIKVQRFKEKDWKSNSNLSQISFPYNVDRSSLSRIQDSILKIFCDELTDPKKLSIEQKEKKVTIVSIVFKNIDETFSKLFCENIAKETSQFYIETKSKKARINTEVLQHQADSVKLELNKAIVGVASETDIVYNLNPSLNIRGSSSKKKQVDVTTNTEVLKQILIQLELSKITLRKETPLIQIIDQPNFPLEKVKFGKLKSLLVGGLVFTFVSILYLIFVDLYKKAMSN